jgi:hypothetical protein
VGAAEVLALGHAREASLERVVLLGQEWGKMLLAVLFANDCGWKRVVLLDRDYGLGHDLIQREGLLGYASSGCG